MNSDLIVYTSYVVLAAVTLDFLWRWQQLTSAYRLVGWWLVCSAVVQGGAELLAEFNTNNLFLSHLFTVISCNLFIHFYQHQLKAFLPKLLLPGTGWGFGLLAVVNVVFWEPLDVINSVTLTTQAVLLIILALSTFILTLNSELNHHLMGRLTSLNWINSGIFIYFSGSLLIFYNGAIIIHAISVYWSEYTWMIHAVLMMVLHGCLLIGLWKLPKVRP